MRTGLRSASHIQGKIEAPGGQPLASFAFLALCAVVFLALCSMTVFYSLHVYLGTLGIGGTQAGLLVGVYSLSALLCYAGFSARIGLHNAFACMASGLAILLACNWSYLIVQEFWPLLMLRVAGGVGIFLLLASAMVVLVAIIPPGRSGQAFSLYSVALLTPYAVMPALSDLILPHLPSQAWLYALSSLILLPAVALLPALRRRTRGLLIAPAVKRAGVTGWVAALPRGPVLLLLLVNCSYFINFAAIFFLFKGLALERAYPHPGLFFTVQMAVMVAIRLLAGRLFDTQPASRLVCGAFVCTAAAFLLLLLTHSHEAVLPIAGLFGLGMGFAVPPLNSLVYRISAPDRRPYNANMMMLSINLGTFLGPFAGSWAVEQAGYTGFLSAEAALSALTAVLFLALNPERALRQVDQASA
ncbi:MFS transporter [Desulfocurvibacter africanus]|uniref:MFS transporter n=1 Tax=Desulfocurvibacter africanus TaxID=873 RepID=UPI00034C12CC|nr:MFS transporter [Desulfocurvibacter africanus]